MKSFKEAPVLHDFGSTTQWRSLAAVPADWILFISDVKNSTPAVKAGKYKVVNTVGASSIMAALNATGYDEIGYVFGGDGATFLVPPRYESRVREALLATRTLAKAEFELDLRIGCVRVGELLKDGLELRCAQYEMAPGVRQTVMNGSALVEAERKIKDPAPGNPHLVPDTLGAPADFTGLECRWQPVRSQHGEIVSLLALATHSSEADQKTYSDVVKKVEEIYTGTKRLLPETLRLSHSLDAYAIEAKVRAPQSRWKYVLSSFLITQGAHVAWEWLGHAFGKRYKKEFADRSDSQKFDGVLRMTLDGTSEQRAALTTFLEEKRAQGQLAYGLHVSPTAIVTCLIFNRSQGNHFHFLDGSDGGFSNAAVQLKSQLASAYCRLPEAA